MKSLRARLTLAIVLVTLVASVVVGVGLGRFTTQEFQQFLEIETSIESVEVPDLTVLLSLLRTGDREAAESEIFAMSQRAGGARLLLFGSDNERIADSAPEGETILLPDGRLDIIGSHEEGGGRREERMSIRGGVVLGDPDEPLGTLFVLPAVDTAIEDDPEKGFTRRISRAHMIGVIVATGLALMIALILSGRILGPVEKLTRAARELEQGDMGQRVEVESRDEIGDLSRAFNSMAESLERQEAARRNMVSDVAHELRTPLTHLRCKLESVQDGLVITDKSLIDDLHFEIVHLGRLVDDLQELALAEAGRLPLYPTKADPASIARQVVAALPVVEGGSSVTVELSGEPGPVHLDVDRFRQVLRNLLQNALLHGAENGHVVVRLSERERCVCCEVQNDGPGIAPEQQQKIFDRFHRTDPSRDRATGGAGLGLAITRQLVLAWDGTIGVDSEPGHGATFWFTIPNDRGQV